MQDIINEYRTIVDMVLAHSENKPGKVAVRTKKSELTYADLAFLMRRAAGVLIKEYGVAKGDKVMLTAVSKPDYVVLYLALQYIGAVTVPADKSALPSVLAGLYRYVEPKLFLTDSRVEEGVNTVSLHDLYARIEEELKAVSVPEESEATEKNGTGSSVQDEAPEYVRPDKEEISEILFTTGTTGTPKGAMLSCGAVQAIANNTLTGTGRTDEDVELIPLPLNHSFGMRVMRAIIYAGATMVLQNGFMFIRETKDNIEKFGCTGISIVAASVEMLHRSMGQEFKEVFGKLKRIEVGASSLSVAMKKRLLEEIPGTRLLNVWGSSETGGAIFLDVTAHPEHAGSVGRPAEGIEVRMVGTDGDFVKGDSPDNAGRMIMRGQMQMSGYLGLPEETSKALSGGYLYTNDMVYMTEDGFVYFLGRADDIINVGGEKVSPIEVESTAGLAEGVKECACVSGKDREGVYDEVPVLFVVKSGESFDEKELQRFLSSKLEQYKIPKYFVETDELPRNSMMKVDRKKLKEMWEHADESSVKESQVISAIKGRKSIRDFTDEPVSHDVLEELVECGIVAPTGYNRQTWRFTVVEDPEKIEALKEAIDEVAKEKKLHVYGFNSPKALIMISNDRRNDDGVQDSACAAENIMIAAHAYGLGSSWVNALMTISDEPRIRNILNELEIPEKHIVWATIVLGHPANQPERPARKKDVVRWF